MKGLKGSSWGSLKMLIFGYLFLGMSLFIVEFDYGCRWWLWV